jgi:hypothetical protein
MSFAVSPEWNTHSECGWCKGIHGDAPQCWCWGCHDEWTSRMHEEDPADVSFMLGRMHMYLCPDCGNKRCPRATHHTNECTGSNKPGQPGSAY